MSQVQTAGAQYTSPASLAAGRGAVTGGLR